MFRKLHVAYTDMFCNPFYNPGENITSRWDECIVFILAAIQVSVVWIYDKVVNWSNLSVAFDCHLLFFFLVEYLKEQLLGWWNKISLKCDSFSWKQYFYMAVLNWAKGLQNSLSITSQWFLVFLFSNASLVNHGLFFITRIFPTEG